MNKLIGEKSGKSLKLVISKKKLDKFKAFLRQVKKLCKTIRKFGNLRNSKKVGK